MLGMHPQDAVKRAPGRCERG